MATVFQVLRDEASWAGSIIASHKWGLPGVKCLSCGATWGQGGVQYPSVDLSKWPQEVEYRRVWPVSPAELEARRSAIKPLLGREIPLPPGTLFGPLVGEATGEFGDFAWRDSWTLLCRPEVITELLKVGVKLPKIVRAILTIRLANVRQLYELELEPRTSIDPSTFPPRSPECGTCGYVNWDIPEPIIIQESSIPADVDIFRDCLGTTLILASHRFVEAVNRLELTGLEFREVQTT